MNKFTDVCKYVVNSNVKVFESYKDAEDAFDKHTERLKAQERNDPLKAFHDAYYDKFRKKLWVLHRERCNFYNFKDVLGFLKGRGMFGTQVFDCHGTGGDYTECIYCKDGVSVHYCGGWDYIEVFGLNDCDFKVLERAYEKRYAEMFPDD